MTHVQGIARKDYVKFDRDQLLGVSRDLAMTGAMKLLDKVQNIPEPEIAMAATAIMFAAFCKRTSQSPQDMHQLGMRILMPQQFHEKANLVGEVLRDWAGIRLAGDRSVEG